MRQIIAHAARGVFAGTALMLLSSAALAGPGGGSTPCQIGKALANGTFLLDANGNGTWEGSAGGDIRVAIAVGAGNGDPLVADWNGDGKDNVGKKVGEKFMYDANGNNAWDGNAGGDLNKTFAGGVTSTVGVAGDFAMSGTGQIGKYQQSTSRFLLDTNGNGTWEGAAAGDRSVKIASSVVGNSQPIVGDFDGDGRDDVGKKDDNEKFFIDLNGNGVWDGNAGGDRAKVFAASFSPSVPVAGDFDGIVGDEIGKWVPSTNTLYMDVNGNGTWDGNAGGDRAVRIAPSAGTGGGLVCDWAGDGTDSAGKYVPSTDKYLIDLNENGVWDGNAGGDRSKTFAGGGSTTGGTGVVGVW